MPENTLTLDIQNCARCQKDHNKLSFSKLDNHEVYTYFAMCPNKQQPILMHIVEIKDEED